MKTARTLKKMIEYNLTAHQRNVSLLVVKGLSNREISQRLGIKESLVKASLTRTYKKLGLLSRAQLIVFFLPTLFGE